MPKPKSTKVLPDVTTLTKAQAKKEWTRLALEMEAHNERYYQKDAPTISVPTRIATAISVDKCR